MLLSFKLVQAYHSLPAKQALFAKFFILYFRQSHCIAVTWHGICYGRTASHFLPWQRQANATGMVGHVPRR